MGKVEIFSIPISFHFLFLLFSLFCLVVIEAQNIVPFPAGTTVPNNDPNVIANEQEYNLQMSGATPTRANQTICTGFTLPATPSEFWIIQFAGNVAANSGVHHMTLYGCDTTPAKPCGCSLPNRSILFSWVRYTPQIRFTGSGNTKAGGFRIGGSSDKQYLFLEIHYHHALVTADTSGITIRTTTTSGVTGKTFYDLAIFSMMTLGTIPGNTNSYVLDNCATLPSAVFTTSRPAAIIGFQVHTHNLGRLVSGYYMNSLNTSPFPSVTAMLGQANPLWPEAYIQPSSSMSPSAASGTGIWTRCVYQSTGVPDATNTNGHFETPTNWHEMCNFNILVAVAASSTFSTTKNAFIKGTCDSLQKAILDGQSTSTTPLAVNTVLDTFATSGTGATRGISYGTAPNRFTMNMGTEKFANWFDSA